MNNETFVISRARLVSLLGATSFPNPDDDTPIWRFPHGPGPVAATWLDFLARVALNPQPIPPGRLFVAALAGAVVERAEQVSGLGGLLPDQENALAGRLNSELAEFIDDCGTMTRWELLQQLLAWLKHHTPPPPQPDPWWQEQLTQNEVILVGSSLAFAGKSFTNERIRETLQNTGDRLIEQNLKQSGAFNENASVPTRERV